METGEEASIQKDIQTRLWDLMVWESEASMRPGAGSYPSQGSGVKDSGGESRSVCVLRKGSHPGSGAGL